MLRKWLVASTSELEHRDCEKLLLWISSDWRPVADNAMTVGGGAGVPWSQAVTLTATKLPSADEVASHLGSCQPGSRQLPPSCCWLIVFVGGTSNLSGQGQSQSHWDQGEQHYYLSTASWLSECRERERLTSTLLSQHSLCPCSSHPESDFSVSRWYKDTKLFVTLSWEISRHWCNFQFSLNF